MLSIYTHSMYTLSLNCPKKMIRLCKIVTFCNLCNAIRLYIFNHNIDTVIKLTVKNDKVVHSMNHTMPSNLHYSSSNSSNWRKHSFKVVLPRKLSNHNDSDLRLMRVSLMNTIAAASVHLLRIEKELKSRGSELTILR